MSFTALVVVYILGGLTFLPFLVAAVFIPAWLLLPRTEDGHAAGLEADSAWKGEGAGQVLDDDVAYEGSAAADATFAVLRSYHFPSALSALNARAAGSNGTAVGAGATSSVDGNGPEIVEAGGGSVYQSMYRTVFDRGKTGATTGVLEKDGEDVSSVEGAAGKLNRKVVVSASVFYIVLRHGHLMLYDTASHTEVRHVISLAHHTISLTDGESDVLPDSDLFIKRTAIVLTPLHDILPTGHPSKSQVPPSPARPKPFYLFSSTCIEKEDFYHALLNTRASPPIPQPIAPEDVIKLQSTLHSTSLTPETRAFNALVGRIFLSLHRTSVLEHEVRTRIQKKISRVQKPAFITSLEVGAVDLGDSAPILSQPRLKDINVSGDITLAFDLRYVGGVRIGIAAVAKIDLGTRFKSRSIDLVLSTSIQRVAGKMLVRIKPSPSNRIWFCFESAPDMDIKVEPVVSSRQITYAFILRAIEERIRTVVVETLVKPNWDDVAFFDTRSQRVRGGIWTDEGAPEEVPADSESTNPAAKALLHASEKSISMPALSAPVDAMESSGSDTATGKHPDSASSTAKEQPAPLKRRPLASQPSKPSTTIPRPDMAPAPPFTKPLRSPSFTSLSTSTPVVAVDGVSGVPVRADDASLQPKNWRTKASAQNANRREAVQAVREMRDRSMPAAAPGMAVPSGNAADDPESETETTETGSRRHSDMSTSPTTYDHPSRTNTARSTANSISSQASRQAQTQRKNMLAATAAATTAARNWGWNAIASRTAGRGGGATGGPRQPLFRGAGTASQTSLSPDQPMGRGQPLPPPGTPLPGPQKGIFAGLGSAVGGRGGTKRKPVLPSRKPSVQIGHGDVPVGLASASGTSLNIGGRHSSEVSTLNDEASVRSMEEEAIGVEDDFGPWRENSGMEDSHEDPESSTRPRVGHTVAAPPSTDTASSASVATGVGEGGQRDESGVRASSGASAEDEQLPPPLPARRSTIQSIRSDAAEHVAMGSPVDVAAEQHHDPSLSEPYTPPAASREATDEGGPTQDNGYAAALSKYIASEEAGIEGGSMDSKDINTPPSELDDLAYSHAGEVTESLHSDVGDPKAESEAESTKPVGRSEA